MDELPEWLKEANVVRGGDPALRVNDPGKVQAIYLLAGDEKPDWRLVLERRGGDLYVVTDLPLDEARRRGFQGG